MSEEDLEVLITLDDPGEEDLEEDTFHIKNDKRPDHRTDSVVDNDLSKLPG